MAHEITRNAITGAFEFAYRADHGHPWHVEETGAARAVDPAKVNDTEEWKRVAGMQWKALRSTVRFATDRDPNAPDLRTLPDQQVLFRSDTKEGLSVVSPSYKIVQPGEILDLFRNLLGVGGLEMSACGTMFGGREFWATAKFTAGNAGSTADMVEGHVLLHTSLDCSHATTMRRVLTRTVCKNTLRMAFAEKAKGFYKCSHRSEFDPQAARAFLGLNMDAWNRAKSAMLRLANREVRTAEAEHTLTQLFAPAASTSTLTGEQIERIQETTGFKKTLALFSGAGMGSRLDTSAGTAWGLLNAVTEYTDHHVRAQSAENRWASAQFGAGDALKQRIADLLAV